MDWHSFSYFNLIVPLFTFLMVLLKWLIHIVVQTPKWCRLFIFHFVKRLFFFFPSDFFSIWDRKSHYICMVGIDVSTYDYLNQTSMEFGEQMMVIATVTILKQMIIWTFASDFIENRIICMVKIDVSTNEYVLNQTSMGFGEQRMAICYRNEFKESDYLNF